jgi:hypothetical protein
MNERGGPTRTWISFAEEQEQDQRHEESALRASLLDKLTGYGCDSGVMETAPTAVLSEIVRVLDDRVGLGDQPTDTDIPERQKASAYYEKHRPGFEKSGIAKAAFIRSFYESGCSKFSEFLG